MPRRLSMIVKWKDGWGDIYEKEFKTDAEGNAFISGAQTVISSTSADFYVNDAECFE